MRGGDEREHIHILISLRLGFRRNFLFVSLGWRTDRKFLRNPNPNEINTYISGDSSPICKRHLESMLKGTDKVLLVSSADRPCWCGRNIVWNMERDQSFWITRLSSWSGLNTIRPYANLALNKCGLGWFGLSWYGLG
jgi:hypothetical protein